MNREQPGAEPQPSNGFPQASSYKEFVTSVTDEDFKTMVSRLEAGPEAETGSISWAEIKHMLYVVTGIVVVASWQWILATCSIFFTMTNEWISFFPALSLSPISLPLTSIMSWVFSWTADPLLGLVGSASALVFFIVETALKCLMFCFLFLCAVGAITSLSMYSTSRNALYVRFSSPFASFAALAALNELNTSLTMIVDSGVALTILQILAFAWTVLGALPTVYRVLKQKLPFHDPLNKGVLFMTEAAMICLFAFTFLEEPIWQEQALHKMVTVSLIWVCAVILSRLDIQLDKRPDLQNVFFCSHATAVRVFIVFVTASTHVAATLLHWTQTYSISWWEEIGVVLATVFVGSVGHTILCALERQAHGQNNEVSANDGPGPSDN